jgi:hypothetical protein
MAPMTERTARKSGTHTQKTPPGWEVTNHTLRLPTPFTLREDEHLVYVCYGDEVLAVFSSEVSSPVIQAAVDRLVADLEALEEQANLERERREEEGTDPHTLRDEIDDLAAAEAWEEQRRQRLE